MIVKLAPEAVRQMQRLPNAIQARMVKLLERLSNWPDVSGAKPLRGALAGSYRLLTGDYRLQFRITGDVVRVDRVGHRYGFYED